MKTFLFLQHLITGYKKKLYHRQQNRRVTAIDITFFLRQFATLIAAAIPLIQALEMLEKSQVKIKLQLLITDLKRQILTGKNLFTALKQHKHFFTELTCQLVQIGEHTGKLDSLLLTIAALEEKKLALRKRLKQALFYPCIITCTAMMVTLSMFIFVIPKFAELFGKTQVTLPLLTRIIFYISFLLQTYIKYFVIGIVIIFIFLWRIKNKFSLQENIQLTLNKIPFIRTYFYKIALARFARNLSITFTAGIPLIDALPLTAQACGHHQFAQLINKLRQRICTGMQLHQAMQSFSQFPALMLQMVKIGEESGNLPYMLNKIADFFETELDELVSQFNQLLEPLIILVLGVLIGGLVIGMYLPIFKLGSAL